jgi:hypothetical protein
MLLNSFAMADFNPTFAVAKRAEALPKQVFDKPNHIEIMIHQMWIASRQNRTPFADQRSI